MSDRTSIKAFGIPNNRGVERATRAARARAARNQPVGSLTRTAIMIGLWDHGSVVGGCRRAEDAEKPPKRGLTPQARNHLQLRVMEAEEDQPDGPLRSLLHEVAVALAIEPDNRHNAEACPHCNPEGRKLR